MVASHGEPIMPTRLKPSLVAFAVLFSLASGAPAARAEEPNSGFVPEFYFNPGYQGCVLRVDLLSDAQSERKRLLLSTLDAAFDHTEGWTRDFVVSGVDYLRFSYFHVIGFGACDNTAAATRYLSSILPDGSYALKTLEGDQSLYTSTDVLDAEDPLGIFVRLLGEDMIATCLVAMTVPRTVAMMQTALNDSYRIRAKYRPPLADLRLVNNVLYLLFSRDCDQKQSLSEAFLELLEHEDADSSGSWSPNYQPDPQAYLRLYGR
jgi:hypothetical protein